ncbi:MAG: hypothetical protein JO053_03405 [Acidobacteria bacterium]|nr:hypothetical protein [Acidobacteriota bacterium]
MRLRSGENRLHLTAKEFEERLTVLQTDSGWTGVRMDEIFKLGKTYQQMPVDLSERF